ncbi:MAG: S1C family serine protease [Vicinamibacterales bacterium]
MTDILSQLSNQLAAAASTAAASVVQLQGHRRLVAGVVVEPDLVLTPGIGVLEGAVPVRRGDGQTFDGAVLGRSAATGLTAVKVPGLGAPPARGADEPAPGHLALAVGRTWSGGVFSALAPVAVVGGPLRTGRTTEIARVVRIGLAPHDAMTGGALVDGAGHLLGIVTSMAIRGTTVVVPAGLALDAARDLAARGGARQGYLGLSSVPVALARAQRAGGRTHGLLVTGLVDGAPAETAGVLVGDIVVAFDGAAVSDADDLVTRLRGAAVDAPTPLEVLRGGQRLALQVAVAERRPG